MFKTLVVPSRPYRAIAAVLVLCLSLVATAAYARFSSVTANPSNVFSASTLSAPSNLQTTASCITSSTVEYRGGSSATGSSGSLTLSKPTGLVAGDVMIAQFAVRSESPSITPPSGWTFIRTDTSNFNGQSTLYWRIATSGEPSSYTWSSNVGDRTAGGILAYSGASSSPIGAHLGSTGADATPIAPSITTPVNDNVLVTFFALRQVALTTGPSGMNLRYNVESAGGAGIVGAAASDEARPTAGATGTRSATKSNSFEWVAQSVAIRPPATPQVNVTWTSTTSTYASGHKLQRWLGAAQQNEQTITPRTQASATDGPLAASTGYTYKLAAYYGNWRSSQVTAGLTTPAC